MTILNTYAAEQWDKVYSAYENVNFTSYDYDTVKESLIQYLQIYYPEDFNNFIESDEMIALLELFAYTTELMAYRTDMAAHENFISTAQRKQSVLRLAKLISYGAARNIPARGLVKINTVRTSETVYDSLGNNLANVTITWNDPNNTNWKEQFILVISLALTNKFGQPSKSYQIADVLMQQYTFDNNVSVFNNGVFAFSASGTTDSIPMEVVPADIDQNGPFERAPDLDSQMSLIFATDGRGDGSDYSGFLLFVKQGNLTLTEYTITEPVVNRRLELSQLNVNDTDVWVFTVDDDGSIVDRWQAVPTLNDQTLAFNNFSGRKKYEIETLENDRIAIVFGDGNFSDIPVGSFQLWTRSSMNESVTVPKTSVIGQPMAFTYQSDQNVKQTFSLTFSLTSTLQNNAPSETIEHIRQTAPTTYYSQNRMVNGQDYNTFMLRDSTILKLNAINRTFAGQPKYLEWNDASGAYQNVKLFGDDLKLFTKYGVDLSQTNSSARILIDNEVEPLLASSGVINALVKVSTGTAGAERIISIPRRRFIEDNRPDVYYSIDGLPVKLYPSDTSGRLQEKTAIQGYLDNHYYGEPLSLVQINGVTHGVIPDPLLNPKTSDKLYVEDLPRTIDGIYPYPPGDLGSGLQSISSSGQFGLKYNRFLKMIGDMTVTYDPMPLNPPDDETIIETLTVEMTSDGTTFTVVSSYRGQLPTYSLTVGGSWLDQYPLESLPIDFELTAPVGLEAGDAIIFDIKYVDPDWSVEERPIGDLPKQRVNLSGYWEIITDTDLDTIGIFEDDANDGPNAAQQMMFDPASMVGYGWIFLIASHTDDLGDVTAWSVYNRTVKTIVESDTTKFWYNESMNLTDPETKKPLHDKIRILRSNLVPVDPDYPDGEMRPLTAAELYDCIGFSYDDDGEPDMNQLEVAPYGVVDFEPLSGQTPQNLIQFETFAAGRYTYTLLDATDQANPVIIDEGVDYDPDDSGTFAFTYGSTFSDVIADQQLVRTMYVDGDGDGLDFMWQHYTPDANLIDPSVSNIHDIYILTNGYYISMQDYVNGFTTVAPTPPTPLDLRTSYGYLLENKMLSDTVVLHPGKIKLLFGSLADQALRAKFRVIMSPTATFSGERIRQEVVNVINTYFQIGNWDFGNTFYATELIALIHQALPSQISSVVIVPTNSQNSFGSLFTIRSGIDEILQSAATIEDVEIVGALTAATLRQNV